MADQTVIQGIGLFQRLLRIGKKALDLGLTNQCFAQIHVVAQLPEPITADVFRRSVRQGQRKPSGTFKVHDNPFLC